MNPFRTLFDFVLRRRARTITITDLQEMENRIMASIDQVLQDVTDESSVIDSISTMVQGLQQQLKDALSGTTLPPAIQAKVDAVFAQAEINKSKLAAALLANTPVEPPATIPTTTEPPAGS